MWIDWKWRFSSNSIWKRNRPSRPAHAAAAQLCRGEKVGRHWISLPRMKWNKLCDQFAKAKKRTACWWGVVRIWNIFWGCYRNMWGIFGKLWLFHWNITEGTLQLASPTDAKSDSVLSYCSFHSEHDCAGERQTVHLCRKAWTHQEGRTLSGHGSDWYLWEVKTLLCLWWQK